MLMSIGPPVTTYGEPPKYSNGQILTIKNLIKTNKINNNDNEVNSTWLFISTLGFFLQLN